MSQKQNVLLVEDDLPIARVYQEYLKKEPYAVTHVDCGKDALDFIDQNTPDVVILDLKLPDMDGIEILKHIQQRAIATAVIVITAHGSVNSAVEAMREGAADFMLKPFNADRLIFTMRHALERQQLTQIVRTLSVDNERTEYCKFIGSSAAMQSIYRTIDNAAPSSATVFITGESGTGKELCAEAIHQQSPRSSKPFVTLNCGAIPENLMESEIFGHVKGAFTGEKLSLQYHHHRSEHWTIVRGVAEVTLDDDVLTLKPDESVYIPLGAIHRIYNPGTVPVHLIEVQIGSYLGEDDIVRLEDIYGRVETSSPPLAVE